MGDLTGYLLSWSAWWLWLLLFLIVALIVNARHDSSFALTDLSYTLPLIGKLRRLAKDYSESSESSDEGWLNVEIALCRDYAKHLSALSQAQFENNTLYLKKSYDHGRQPIPFWATTNLTLLVILESLGFSFMLSTLMVTEGTENQHNLLTLAIVLVLAAILVWITHTAGHQLYRTGLLRTCYREYQMHGDDAFSSQIVSLDDNQWLVDRAQRPHVQCANRVITNPGDRGTYWWVWLAVLLIFAIAIGATKLRIESLHGAAADGGAFISDIFNIGDDQTAVAAPAQGEYAETANAREQAALTGFTILGTIFLVTQFMAMSLGYWYGFAGKQSAAAYRTTRGAADYETYWAPIQRRMNIANGRLYTLHRLLEWNFRHLPRFRHTILDFIMRERARGSIDLHLPPMPAPERWPPTSDEIGSIRGKAAEELRPAPGSNAPQSLDQSDTETGTKEGDDGESLSKHGRLDELLARHLYLKFLR